MLELIHTALLPHDFRSCKRRHHQYVLTTERFITCFLFVLLFLLRHKSMYSVFNSKEKTYFFLFSSNLFVIWQNLSYIYAIDNENINTKRYETFLFGFSMFVLFRRYCTGTTSSGWWSTRSPSRWQDGHDQDGPDACRSDGKRTLTQRSAESSCIEIV